MIGKGPEKNKITLPPRTESVVKIPVKPGSPTMGEIEKCQLLDGVFLAASLSQVNEGYVLPSILNTNETETVIEKPLVDLEEVNLIENHTNASRTDSSNREVEIFKQLRVDHLNAEERGVD
jgi:hypothetical protein